jgi:toxin ParE1/3/4
VANCVLDPCIEEELWEIWDYIAKDNPTAASQVIQATRDTFKTLAANPGIGRPRGFQDQRIRGIHVRPVTGFDRYLIYYRKISDGIQVIHVLHDARKIERLFRKR